uniref:Uncharacterized protein n=1 Tax=Zea mays TaxID=4577 RepID=C4J8H2_MAIZE|nr:unknown [Zea mays]
MHACMLRPKRI